MIRINIPGSIILYFSSFGFSLFFVKRYGDLSNTTKNYKLKKIFFFILVLFPIVFVSTYRFGIGTDYFRYETIFYENNVGTIAYQLSNSPYNNEPLFILLNRVAMYLFNDFRSSLMLSSLLSYSAILLTLNYFKSMISLRFALFISLILHYHFSFNGVRQMIAMSIVFYSFRYLYTSNFFKFVGTIIIASFFHNTALIMIIIYLFSIWNIDNKQIKAYFNFLYFLLISFSPIIMLLALRIFSRISLFAEYSRFVKTDIDFGIGFLIYVFPLFLPLIIFNKYLQDEDNIFLDISLLRIPFAFIGYYVEFGTRMALYTELSFYIIIPLLIFRIKNQKHKMIVIVYYTLYFLIYYFYNFLILNQHETYPYVFT